MASLFEESPLVKQAMQEALGDLKHQRYVTLKDYLRGKRSSQHLRLVRRKPR